MVECHVHSVHQKRRDPSIRISRFFSEMQYKSVRMMNTMSRLFRICFVFRDNVFVCTIEQVACLMSVNFCLRNPTTANEH